MTIMQGLRKRHLSLTGSSFLLPRGPYSCVTEIRLRYWEPNPRSNCGIGIAKIFFLKPKLNLLKFSHVFCFLGGYGFQKPKIGQRFSKIIIKFFIFACKFGLRGPFMIEKIPHNIGNQILFLKCGFSISYGIGQKYQPILVSVSVLDLNQNSGFGRTLEPYSEF